MNQKDIFDRVKKIVIEQLSVEEKDRVVPNTGILYDLRADSLDLVELKMVLEEEFEGTISDEDAENLFFRKDKNSNYHDITIQEVADYISKRISEKG